MAYFTTLLLVLKKILEIKLYFISFRIFEDVAVVLSGKDKSLVSIALFVFVNTYTDCCYITLISSPFSIRYTLSHNPPR